MTTPSARLHEVGGFLSSSITLDRLVALTIITMHVDIIPSTQSYDMYLGKIDKVSITIFLMLTYLLTKKVFVMISN